MAEAGAGSTLHEAGALVEATGLNIGQWPPDQVRGLFIDVGLIAALLILVWRVPWAPVIKAVGSVLRAGAEAIKAWADARREEAAHARARVELARAEAERTRAQADALGRIQSGRRADDP